MDIASISSQITPASLDHLDKAQQNSRDPATVKKVAQQFESIILRQMLGESMKPLLQDGPSGQVYGYFLTDSLANEISQAGGLGLSHILQSDLTPKSK